MKMKETKMRGLEILVTEIDKFPLGTLEGISGLRAHIRTHWTIREILVFKNFTFKLKDLGYVGATPQEIGTLTTFFECLAYEAFLNIGATAYLKVKTETTPQEIEPIRTRGKEHRPNIPELDMTLEALEQLIPNAASMYGMLTQILAGVNQGNAALQAQGADIKRGADAAEEAAKTAAETRDPAITCFNKLSANDRKNYGPKASQAKDPSLKSKDWYVLEAWIRFSSGDADPELPDGTLRRTSGRRSFAEFYAAYENEIVFNNKTLGELYPVEFPFTDVERKQAVENMKDAIDRESKRRRRAEGSAKAKPPPPCPPPPPQAKKPFDWRR